MLKVILLEYFNGMSYLKVTAIMVLNVLHFSLSIVIIIVILLFPALGQNNDKFDLCPLEALEWKRRRCHMLEEIISYNPDIICLQVNIKKKRICNINILICIICFYVGS